MKKIIQLVTVALVLSAFVWSALNVQYIGDRIVASQFTPSPKMSQIISDLQLTDTGLFVLTTARPELNDQQSFNQHCQKKQEKTIVLGCYVSPYNIHIYDVEDARLDGVRQVTTAHEMLHVAYERLSVNEKEKVDTLIKQALPAVQAENKTLAERLTIYDKTEPGERNNELHSILGTEAHTLPHELEVYYQRYFKNRTVVVSFADAYSNVFASLQQNQQIVIDEMKALNQDIEQRVDQYNVDIASLNTSIEAFNQRAQISGGFNTQEEFDQQKQVLVSLRAKLEDERLSIDQKIEQYNKKRDQLQALNVQIDELNTKLDSTAIPSI